MKNKATVIPALAAGLSLIIIPIIRYGFSSDVLWALLGGVIASVIIFTPLIILIKKGVIKSGR
ncbi:MAG: hypothetical protein KJ709_01720 [Nanoarchaeota archaeon]|nr:hypothetical protein [Nanoarchaeota archaeon]